MKTSRSFPTAALALALSLSFLAAALVRTPQASAQQYGALERGYRTGYSDGYQSGWGDQLKGARADYQAKADYRSADRAYITAYGAVEDYRDGYQQGYEVGYEAGYARQGFDSELPAGGVTRRGASPREAASNGSDRGGRSADDERNESSSQGGRGGDPGRNSNSGGPSAVSSNVVLTIELSNRLTTDVSQKGDHFEARVVEPQEFAGAVVAGHLADVQRAGKAKGRALLQLEFEQIRMPGSNDWQQLSAQVVEVLQPEATGTSEVDEEGGVRGRDTTKEDVAKVGGGAAVGAIIGAIAGGGKGAAIGAILGGGAGTASVMTQRGKDIRLESGQQLRIRTTGRK
ncbi:MAG: hypothetical protein QOH49_3290 [Acidobacteriota bacterium]|jgi:hypothetical protein|nr:hypothetical protein [Acidobacteriota bacterium]